MDANRNGVLEPNEVPEERRGMLRYMAGRMGVDPEKPISLDKVRESMARRDREREEGRDSDPSSSEPEPLVPGFGEEQELPRVPAFGERVEYASLFASASQQALANVEPEAASRIRRGVDAMFYRFDRNRNGVLEEDESAGMRIAEGADGNNDGKITKDELTVRLAEFSGRRSSESERERSDSGDSDDSDSGHSNHRRSYRFRRASELLPPGLPDWFASHDANGDGQVAMAEYSSSWSDSEVREFNRYDLNHDGLITPRECLGAPTEPGGFAAAEGAPPGAESSGADDRPSGDSKDEGGSSAWWLQ
jgi:hypothetical protein